MFFLTLPILGINCKENPKILGEPYTEKNNLNGNIFSIATYINIERYDTGLDTLDQFVDSLVLNEKGFVITEISNSNTLDSIIINYFYNENYLIDSSLYEYYSLSDYEYTTLLAEKDSVKWDTYYNISQEKVFHFYYDSLNRLIKKVGLNQKRDTLRVDNFEFVNSRNRKIQNLYFPTRDFNNKIIHTYNEKNQLISTNYTTSMYHKYFYYDNGLMKGYNVYLSSPVEEPIIKIDSIIYEFDSNHNWIEKTKFEDGRIKIRLKRRIIYY